MNFLDNAISFFNPKAGFKRAQQRAALDTLKRGYDAARKDKRSAGWKVVDDKFRDIDENNDLRKRSKDLFKNNPYSRRAHTSIKNNTVGTGILPAIKDANLKKVWKDWAESTLVDFDEHLDFAGLTWLCMGTMSVQGNCLILRIKSKSKTRVPLELKVLPITYLDKSKDTNQTAGKGWVIGGVAFDSEGKLEGYWIFDQDPLMQYSQSRLWKKEDVIHLFELNEPGQILGVPFGVSSIMSLRDFDDYADAQLMRQKVAACFSIFITEPDSGAPTGVNNSKESENNIEKVEPGLIEHLAPGKQVSFASPPPAEGYGEYSRSVLTGIASGFGTTYEAMTNDLSNVNFSSGRMGWLEYGRNIESWQWFIIIPKFCKKVWVWFVEAGIISGLVNKDAPLSIEWTAPRRQMIDPVKEINGLLAQVRAGFMSWQEAVRSLGYTPEEILDEMKASKKLFDDAGLAPESDPRYDVKTPYNSSDDKTKDDSGKN